MRLRNSHITVIIKQELASSEYPENGKYPEIIFQSTCDRYVEQTVQLGD